MVKYGYITSDPNQSSYIIANKEWSQTKVFVVPALSLLGGTAFLFLCLWTLLFIVKVKPLCHFKVANWCVCKHAEKGLAEMSVPISASYFWSYVICTQPENAVGIPDHLRSSIC